MAGSLKEHGRKELEAFRRRVKRQYALRRIGRGEMSVLLSKVDDLDAYVLKMQEGNVQGSRTGLNSTVFNRERDSNGG